MTCKAFSIVEQYIVLYSAAVCDSIHNYCIISLQLIEKWISGVISERNDGKPTDQTQVTLIWAVAVSIFCVGGMVGGLSTGFVAEKFGRKGGLLVSNALVVLSAALQGKR